MSWVVQGERRYYTRSVKAAGVVRRIYIGGGVLGELAAAADAQRRAVRQANAASVRAEQARWQAALAPLLELSCLTGALSKAAMFSAGYHLHARSIWRKKRHARTEQNAHDSGRREAGSPAVAGATSATG